MKNIFLEVGIERAFQMNMDGMSIIQGSKGSGKSATAVAMAIKQLKSGGVVAANFSLKDGWADEIAKRHWRSYLSEQFRYDYALSLWSRFFVVDSVAAIDAIDVFKLATDKKRSKEGHYQEGQGLLLLDECALFLNSRKSMSGDKNLGWVEFFTQARKKGWIEVLIAHKAEMIDSQIRDMAEYESRFRNLQKVRVPVIGCPLVPFPVFLIINRYAGYGPGSGCIHSRDLCPLPVWAARLYDTRRVFRGEDMISGGAPSMSGPPPSPPLRGGEGAFPHQCIRQSKLVGPHWDNYLMTFPGAGFSDQG